MAWPNLPERRERVRRDLAVYGSLTPQQRAVIATEFSCTPAAVYQDEIALTVKKLAPGSFHINKAMRGRIRNRDGYTCQYCGDDKASTYIIEHVIPYALGGVAKEYNLVMACQKCNITKRSSVWVPNNLDAITANNSAWREMVLNMSRNGNASAEIERLAREAMAKEG